MSNQIRTLALCAAGFAANTAHAQAAAPALPAQPASSAYNSAFEGYRPFAVEEVADWRKANDTVREVGGWRAYAREIQRGATQPPAPSPATPAAAPAAHPHQGHRR